MANLKITTNTNADAVWLWELLKKLGYLVEIVFDYRLGNNLSSNRELSTQNQISESVSEISKSTHIKSRFPANDKPSCRGDYHQSKKTTRKRRK